ncbi:spore germination lipoprotein GerD [Niallia sp. XMNu-256]|uniref:spore germination lipoprotein GerD n=1 Tax=Niallia sp. XMNu-256 TaxID=3082444 RepID=UPI0030CC0FCA
MKRALLLSLIILSVFITTSCGGQAQVSRELDYEETKKMVVDILKTDEGKKAIQDVMSDEKLRQQLIMDQAIVTETIQSTLTSEKGADFWKKNFEDPAFAEKMAQSMQQQHEQLLKSLMNDPEYRTKLIEVMKDPELIPDLTTILKSNEYRDHLKTVISETIESPLYQTKIQELLLKAAEKKADEEKKAAEA